MKGSGFQWLYITLFALLIGISAIFYLSSRTKNILYKKTDEIPLSEFIIIENGDTAWAVYDTVIRKSYQKQPSIRYY